MRHCIYPGTFDPITYGHLDVLARAARLFDKVTVAVAQNAGKEPLFTAEQRLEMLRPNLAAFPHVELTSFGGLLVDFARAQKADAIIRGLRALSDFEFEFNMALMNRHLQPQLETIFVMPNEQFSYTSSTLVKQVARYGGDVSDFVPPNVAAELNAPTPPGIEYRNLCRLGASRQRTDPNFPIPSPATPIVMAKSKKSYTGLIVLIVLIAAAAGGFYYWQAHKDKGPEFYTADVSKGDIVQTVTASGTIKPLVDVIVSSQISGYVTSWKTDFNAKVKKGDLMATLLPTTYQAAVKSAEGDLANAKANLDLQTVTLNRDKELLAKSLIVASPRLRRPERHGVEEASARRSRSCTATLETALDQPSAHWR